MPIEFSLEFLVKFIELGWIQFYKMALAILRVLEPYILNLIEIDQIMWLLKFREISHKKNHSRASSIDSMKNPDVSHFDNANVLIETKVFDGRMFKKEEKNEQKDLSFEFDEAGHGQNAMDEKELGLRRELDKVCEEEVDDIVPLSQMIKVQKFNDLTRNVDNKYRMEMSKYNSVQLPRMVEPE